MFHLSQPLSQLRVSPRGYSTKLFAFLASTAFLFQPGTTKCFSSELSSPLAFSIACLPCFRLGTCVVVRMKFPIRLEIRDACPGKRNVLACDPILRSPTNAESCGLFFTPAGKPGGFSCKSKLKLRDQMFFSWHTESLERSNLNIRFGVYAIVRGSSSRVFRFGAGTFKNEF